MLVAESKVLKVEFVPSGAELFWVNCTVFPVLGTGDTTKFEFSLYILLSIGCW